MVFQGAHFRERTLCPGFILSIAGPSMCVLGGILIDGAWNFQSLTDFVWTGNIQDPNRQAKKVARLFCSLRQALVKLADRFKAVVDSPAHSPPHSFPYITSFHNATMNEIKFSYKKRLHYNADRRTTAVFLAETENGESIFVKFATQYNMAVHALLANAGYAP